MLVAGRLGPGTTPGPNGTLIETVLRYKAIRIRSRLDARGLSLHDHVLSPSVLSSDCIVKIEVILMGHPPDM